MRLLALVTAVAVACGPQAAAPSASPASSPSLRAAPSETASVSPTAPIALRDISIVPAGDIRGEHALVAVGSQNGSNGGGSTWIWDVPLDGTPPRSLVAYTRAERPTTGYLPFELSRQLAPDGRQLVLTDAADIAGRGLLLVDLIGGTARAIATPEAADDATWSPDGQWIAYRGFSLQGPLLKESGLWVVSVSGGASRQFWVSDRTTGGYATSIYGWTEDGLGIAVTRDYQSVDVIDVASGRLKRMSGWVNGIAWRAKRPSLIVSRDQDVPLPSPTGPRGAPGNIGRPEQLEISDTTFAAPRVIYRHENVGTLLWSPRWSPVSDEVLFHWACGAGARCLDELFVIDAATGTHRSLRTVGPVYASAWSGDGARILYADTVAVRVMKADGTGDRELFRPGLTPTGTQAYVGGVIAFGRH